MLILLERISSKLVRNWAAQLIKRWPARETPSHCAGILALEFHKTFEVFALSSKASAKFRGWHSPFCWPLPLTRRFMTAAERSAIASADRGNEAAIVAESNRVQWPHGFFRTIGARNSEGWGHFCPVCKHLTLRENPVRPGMTLKAWHCGRPVEHVITLWRFATLPKIRVANQERVRGLVGTLADFFAPTN
jgi:hypothetical protein